MRNEINAERIDSTLKADFTQSRLSRSASHEVVNAEDRDILCSIDRSISAIAAVALRLELRSLLMKMKLNEEAEFITEKMKV